LSVTAKYSSVAGAVDQPGDRVPVQWCAVRPGQQQRMAGGHVLGPVVVDEREQVGMQW
jgi:hypothetical protein